MLQALLGQCLKHNSRAQLLIAVLSHDRSITGRKVTYAAYSYLSRGD